MYFWIMIQSWGIVEAVVAELLFCKCSKVTKLKLLGHFELECECIIYFFVKGFHFVNNVNICAKCLYFLRLDSSIDLLSSWVDRLLI